MHASDMESMCGFLILLALRAGDGDLGDCVRQRMPHRRGPGHHPSMSDVSAAHTCVLFDMRSCFCLGLRARCGWRRLHGAGIPHTLHIQHATGGRARYQHTAHASQSQRICHTDMADRCRHCTTETKTQRKIVRHKREWRVSYPGTSINCSCLVGRLGARSAAGMA